MSWFVVYYKSSIIFCKFSVQYAALHNLTIYKLRQISLETNKFRENRFSESL